jgi:glycosyltransferase involved in cell wall biosynthesis
MNVTTSANWNRPVVGVVRVEQSLCAELGKVYGHQFKECHWQNEKFIERLPSAEGPEVEQKRTRAPGHNRFSRFFSLLREPNDPLSCLDAESETAQTTSPLADSASSESSPFVAGDILISVGLDWNHTYHKKLHTLRKDVGIRIITCCHDLIPVLYPHYCAGDVSNYYKQYFLDLAWGSDAILCVSKQSERDLKQVLEEVGAPPPRTCVITHGDNVPAGSGDISKQVAEIARAPFLLFVSTIERRKNHAVLYSAYHLLCEAGKREVLPKLVFVGMPGWGAGDFLKDVELDPLTQGLIVQLHNVNDAELRLLYEAALFCLYPSFYEGWGLPVGEALALGKAVLSSDRGSLPEVGGELVRYVDPWNPVAWAEAIWSLTRDDKERKAIESKVRSTYKAKQWEETAATVKTLINSILMTPRDLELSPGYDMSTIAGEKFGGLLRSTAQTGYLMYGPRRGFDVGCYRIRIWDIVGEREAGKAQFDLASKLGTDVHWFEELEIKGTNGGKSGEPLLDFKIDLDEPVADLEIRCKVLRGALTLSGLRIQKVGQGTVNFDPDSKVTGDQRDQRIYR